MNLEYALWMWAYALVWFVVSDVVKMFTYRLLRAQGSM
jgi:H+-transporting ATPase